MNRGTTHTGTPPSSTLALIARQHYWEAPGCSRHLGSAGPGMNRGTTHTGTPPSSTLALIARQLYWEPPGCSRLFGSGGPGKTMHTYRRKLFRAARDAANVELAGN